MLKCTEALTMELKIEGHTTKHASTLLDMTAASQRLIKDYLDGKLDVVEEMERRTAAQANISMHGSVLPVGCIPTPEQIHFETNATEIIELVERARGEDVVAAEDARGKLWDTNKIISVTGPPGTGKTAWTHRIIERVLAGSGQVCFDISKIIDRLRFELAK